LSSGFHFEGGLSVCPGGVFVVDDTVSETAVEDADKSIAQGAECLVVEVAFGSPDHQSVIVKGADLVEVIAAQAVYDLEELEGEVSIEPLSEEEARQTSASARLIKTVQSSRMFFSHDPRVWLPNSRRGQDWPHA